MKKKIYFLFFLVFIFTIIFFTIKDKFNINKLVDNIESNTGLDIKFQDNHKWDYYPKITYQNKLNIKNDNINLVIENSKVNISKDYRINSPFVIKFESPSILYKGINFRNSRFESEYDNNLLNIQKYEANIIDGNININGYIHLKDHKKITLHGVFNNISVNRVLKQLNISNWERVKIKLSSPNFTIDLIDFSTNEMIENLNGEIDITGSVFFVSKEEERFGAAFLSLLAEKFQNLKPVSKSISYLLDEFSDVPSDITGKININNGILSTKKLLINNHNQKALVTGNFNLNNNLIAGKIDLYKDDIIFLTVELGGNIESPKILIAGEIFSEEAKSKPLDIKKVFEEGIQSLVDNILNSND